MADHLSILQLFHISQWSKQKANFLVSCKLVAVLHCKMSCTCTMSCEKYTALLALTDYKYHTSCQPETSWNNLYIVFRLWISAFSNSVSLLLLFLKNLEEEHRHEGRNYLIFTFGRKNKEPMDLLLVWRSTDQHHCCTANTR